MLPVKVPRFQVDRTLGSGSTGEVLHGQLLEEFENLPAGTEIAVKYLHAKLTDERNATLAFEREAETALTVKHDGLVRAVARGEDERGPFIIMEYVPGQTLREVLAERGPLPEPTLRSVATQVAGGLSALHSAGYIHGDVKPENIRLDGSGRAVLVDLGFARRPSKAKSPSDASATTDVPLHTDSDSTASRSGSRAAGTLLYLAPERLRGEPGRASSDIFALGLVLYELSTGEHPFVRRHSLEADPPGSSKFTSDSNTSSRDMQSVIERMLAGNMRQPSIVDPMLSPFLDAVITACLAESSQARPTAEVLRSTFERGEASDWWRQRIDFAAAARAVGRDRHHFTPLVGRSREIASLHASAERGLDSTIDARAQLLWLEGELGSGKTRLARELAARVRSRETPPVFLYGRCWGMRENRPCQPLLRMVQRYLGLPRNGVPGERDREHLASLLPPQEAETLLRSLDPHGVSGTPVSVPAALAAWFLALGNRHPVLFFLDDLHHADSETLRALNLIAEGMESTHMFAMLAVGTDEAPRNSDSLWALRDRLSSYDGFHSRKLEHLTESDVQELTIRLFDHQTPVLRLGSTLWKRSQGHPGFLSELLRGMLARGDMSPSFEEPEHFSLNVSPSDLPKPATFQRAIRDSFLALDESDRAWLQRFAIVGRKIETEFLLRVFPSSSRSELDEVLSRLVRANWLVPHGKRFRFSRPASRETVYRSISPGRRKRLHGVAAGALKPLAGVPITIADAFQRAFHLRASEHYAELLLVLRPLLQRLASSGMPQRVWRLSSWGLEALSMLSATDEHRAFQLELLEHSADAADSLGRRAEERVLLDQLAEHELAGDATEPDPLELGRIYLLHGRYSAGVGRYGLSRGWLKNAANCFEAAHADELRSDSLRRLALVQALSGEFVDARKQARAAILAAGDAPAALGRARLALATIYLLLDRLEAALGETSRAMVLLRDDRCEGVGGALAEGHILRARIYRSLGRPIRALGAANRGLQLARGCGERRLEVEAGARLGGLLLYTDRDEEAEARLRESRLLANEVEDKSGHALASLFLGVLLGEADRTETRNRVEEATRLASEAGLYRTEALSLAIEARLDLQARNSKRAHECADRTAYLLERYGAELFDRVVIEGTAALVAREFGNAGRADELERALKRRLKRESARLGSDVLRRRHRAASNRLLETVLSKDGPLYPRLRISESL